VSLVAELELRSGLLQRVMDRVLPVAIADIIAAFEARALQYPSAKGHAGKIATG
jgi:hypothetical protein